MLADMKEAKDYGSALEAKLRATEEFATSVIAKL
jgi:hypothetical protein